MATLIKRSQIQAFLNTTGKAKEPIYKIIGNYMPSGNYEYNPQATTETYIVNDNATSTLDSYQIAFDGEMKCAKGDAVFDYIDGLRYNVAVGDDAVSEVVLVDTYEPKGSGGGYRAQKFACTVSVNSFGGDGGQTPTISFNIAVNGDPVQGTATISAGTCSFTAEMQ